MGGALDQFIQDGFKINQAKDIPPIRSEIHAVTAAELAEREFEPLAEPVQGLIVEGLTLLCGASKIGKSWLALQMCAAVSTGEPFLGRKTEPGSVLYLAYEDSERRLKSRLESLLTEPGPKLNFDTNIIRLDSGLIDALQEWVSACDDARLIVVDTLQKVRGQVSTRVNAYAEDYRVVGDLKTFADANHVAVVLIHHLNKLRDVDDPFDKISGSTGLMGAADTAILVTRKRGEEDATVTYTGRDVHGDDFQIRFANCRWRVCDPAILAQEQYEREPVVQAVKHFIGQGTFDGTYSASYADFRQWAVEKCGLFVGVNQQEVRKGLERFGRQLEQYDGILVSLDKRVGTKRGFTIAKKGGERK